jgi:hypothetical protein
MFLARIGLGFGLSFTTEPMKNSFVLSFRDFFGDVGVYISKVSKFDLEDNGVYVLGACLIINYGNEDEEEYSEDSESFSFRQYYNRTIDFGHPDFCMEEDFNIFLLFYSELVEKLKEDFENKGGLSLTLVDKDKG